MIKLNGKLSYALYFVLVVFLFTGCSNSTERRFEALEVPIVLVAESLNGTVILVDKNNTYLIIATGYYMADAIANSYNKGDTLDYN